jgi:basic membrane protein A and related proteins
MTDFAKRRLLTWAGLSTLAATAALVGCGKKDEPAPTAAAPTASAAASAPAPKPEPLKAAWVYVGPVGDAGWTSAARKPKPSSGTPSRPPSSRRCPKAPTPSA